MSLRGDLIRLGINCTFSNVILGVPLYKYMPVPAAMTTAATITSSNLTKGIITGTHAAGATQAYTLPLGTDFDEDNEQRGIVIGSSFDFTIINLSVDALDTITLTANTGFTIVGQPIIHANEHLTSYYCNMGTFKVRKTAANTFVAYRTS